MSVPVMRHTSTKLNFVVVIINPSLHETTTTALPSLNSMMLAVLERLALAGNHVFCHPEIPGAHCHRRCRARLPGLLRRRPSSAGLRLCGFPYLPYLISFRNDCAGFVPDTSTTSCILPVFTRPERIRQLCPLPVQSVPGLLLVPLPPA